MRWNVSLWIVVVPARCQIKTSSRGRLESVELRNQRLVICEMGSLRNVLALIIFVIGAGRGPSSIAKRTLIVRKQWIAELLRQDVKFSG
jgi:hypothetical protein